MNLFIDDERFPTDDSWNVVRSSQEAIEFVKKNGVPQYISFDHDLGGDDTSIVFINWLIEEILDKKLTLPVDFDFYVHSQNCVGKKNIENKMNSFIKFIYENNELSSLDSRKTNNPI